MQSFDIAFLDEAGMHTRPAARLVQVTKQFGSTVVVSKGDKRADGKNLVKLMGLGVNQGDMITVEADGADEAAALAAVKVLLDEINASFHG
ncbi:HPr family phosphocarrier protein [Jeongeupia sp. USM3]|uniref:HPr family phosphocarrier protein n=1 Tax=Jeongeupia sp. USM3 TaxID=1906741 RepID=UPI00089DEED1|nr:HPr family phosphocarrier protein [Jeongeupia sp. USM3]AOY01110.1 hypothetical protein BJP62_12040 [Jeongeupia sp. USM3]